MKKRQQDFHKTKARVGKKLPKGLNVTDTSFKTRKIIKPDQLKKAPEEKNIDDLFKLLTHKTTKATVLSKINNYIGANEKELFLKFPQILKSLSSLLIDHDKQVRENAIILLGTCLKLSSESRVMCFQKEIGLYLRCMMTVAVTPVQEDSFKVLEVLFQTHPLVVCQSVQLLKTLLNMISYVPDISGSTGQKKRKLNEFIDSHMTSQVRRVNVLSCMRTCMNFMLSQCEVESPVVVKEVYVDGTETAVYAPIYRGGGARPMPLESSKPTMNILSGSSAEFREFVSDLVPLLSAIVKSEMGGGKSEETSDSIFSYKMISTLNAVAQVLCSLGEWFQKVRKDSKDQNLIDAIKAIVCNQLLPCFPYFQQTSGKRKQVSKEFSCSNLNLSISYLYSVFVLNTLYHNSYKVSKILHYLAETYRVSSNLDRDSIALTLKTSKIMILSSNVETAVIDGILLGLLGFLDVYRFTEIGNSIYSLFSELTFDFKHKYLWQCEGMRMWFQVIFKELDFMKKAKVVNKDFIQYVTKLSAVSPQPFADFLNNKVEQTALADLLKHPDEDFQMMAITLANKLDKIDTIFLEFASHIVREPTFSMRNFTSMMNLFHYRFNKPTRSDREKLLFVKFLMNVGCDIAAITTPPSEDEKQQLPDPIRKAMELCQVEIFPPRNLDRCQEMLKLCMELLKEYFQQKQGFVRCAVLFQKSLLSGYSRYPLQCALALMTLRRATQSNYQDTQLAELYGDLLFTCYAYMSFLIYENNPDNIKRCGVQELQNRLIVSEIDIAAMVHVMSRNYSDLGHNELFHILRILLYLIKLGMLNMRNGNCCDKLLKKLGDECQMSETLRPFFLKVAASVGYYKNR